ncbi:MAG: recombinase family protein, partial [Oscillospiraceae bacterium]|nr:recombinase family protein [Oscillospiraceae bacterium]
MKKTERTYHLKNILELKHNMKIVIDEAVELDEDDNFLINVGYLRVSTDRQADLGFGLDIQEADIIRYCTANGYKNLVLFIDDGYTGTNMERPALQEIMGAITDF